MKGSWANVAGAAPESRARPRRRLSRTFTAPRWREYRELLEDALENGYRVIGVEDWVAGESVPEPILVLRHDVDQHPRSALAMARVEGELGLRSAWYFRWRTADPRVVGALREAGHSVGFHYETLSRLALERGARTSAEVGALAASARAGLREEIAAFVRLHGPIRSVCPHGDSRAPLASNASLMKGCDAAEFGVEFDVNEAMRGRGLAHWLTDRSRAEGRWADRVRPGELLAERGSPILCVVHPNNWSSGPSLWLDRLLAAVLPKGDDRGRRPGPLRTGLDAPPA
jgi:hypothetical protein